MAPTESTRVTADNVTDLAAARQTKEARAKTDEIEVPKNRRFDKEKVARLKAAIADGSYQINPARIVDKFIEHERN